MGNWMLVLIPTVTKTVKKYKYTSSTYGNCGTRAKQTANCLLVTGNVQPAV